MTIKVRAKVQKLGETMPGDPRWFTMAYTQGDDRPAIFAWSESHPEALQAAYKLMSDIDQELMDEVHASRAQRRQEATA